MLFQEARPAAVAPRPLPPPGLEAGSPPTRPPYRESGVQAEGRMTGPAPLPGVCDPPPPPGVPLPLPALGAVAAPATPPPPGHTSFDTTEPYPFCSAAEAVLLQSGLAGAA